MCEVIAGMDRMRCAARGGRCRVACLRGPHGGKWPTGMAGPTIQQHPTVAGLSERQWKRATPVLCSAWSRICCAFASAVWRINQSSDDPSKRIYVDHVWARLTYVGSSRVDVQERSRRRGAGALDAAGIPDSDARDGIMMLY